MATTVDEDATLFSGFLQLALILDLMLSVKKVGIKNIFCIFCRT